MGGKVEKSKIYLDQNILGYIHDGSFPLKDIQNIEWIYSDTHFSEFGESAKYKDYLSVLDKLDAKYLTLELDEQFNITGTASVNYSGTPAEHLCAYLKAIHNHEANDRVFDPLIAYLNGGKVEQSSEIIAKETFSIINELDRNGLLTDFDKVQFEKQQEEYSSFLHGLFSTNNDIIKMRKQLNIPRSGLTELSGDDVLKQIWQIVRLDSDYDIDVFFGFKTPDGAVLPVCVGIASCCSVLDIVGFHSERKCRKVDKIANVISDSMHIAKGAFCSAIISEDKALVERAKAIYEYKGISTKVFQYRG